MEPMEPASRTPRKPHARTLRSAATAFLLASLSLAAACGDDDDGPATTIGGGDGATTVPVAPPSGGTSLEPGSNLPPTSDDVAGTGSDLPVDTATLTTD